MRKHIVLLALVLAFLFRTTPGQRIMFAADWWYSSTYENVGGLYSPYLDEYYCNNPSSCLHEQGHSEDRNLNWYSDSPEFVADVTNCDDPYVQFAARTEDDPKELYADIYSLVSPEGTLVEYLEAEC